MEQKTNIYDYLYINENMRLILKKGAIFEGGFSRNIALMKWIKTNVKHLKEIELTNNKIANIFIVLFVLSFAKKKNIIFQDTNVGVPLHNSSILGKLCRNLFLNRVKYSAKYNKVIFDVSDLKFEQAIDLELNRINTELIEKFEIRFFKLPVFFIFASNSMREFACDKYQIEKGNTDVCINGGNSRISLFTELGLTDFISEDKINYVYAGSLNKGRQIEQMISSFSDSCKAQLVLMGTEGEWLKKIKLKNNIIYFEAQEQEKAHYIVSKCDVGLIPYDEQRLYYNLAYPTKLSFYITAGIPFLSTPVSEVEHIQKKYGIGFISPIINWNKIIDAISKTEIAIQKQKLVMIKKNFYWETIFSNNKFIK